jgi:hypothetical protein
LIQRNLVTSRDQLRGFAPAKPAIPRTNPKTRTQIRLRFQDPARALRSSRSKPRHSRAAREAQKPLTTQIPIHSVKQQRAAGKAGTRISISKDEWARYQGSGIGDQKASDTCPLIPVL